MKRFLDKSERLHTVDRTGNHFINGKLDNPKSYENREVGDTVSDYELVENPLVIGHVPNFTYGYGEREVKVSTGQKAW